MKNAGKCCEPDCTRDAFCRGMCQLHYSRWVARGGRGTTCTEPGCNRPRIGKLLCGMHVSRARRARLAAKT